MYLDAYGQYYAFLAVLATMNVRRSLMLLDTCPSLGVCVLCLFLSGCVRLWTYVELLMCIKILVTDVCVFVAVLGTYTRGSFMLLEYTTRIHACGSFDALSATINVGGVYVSIYMPQFFFVISLWWLQTFVCVSRGVKSGDMFPS